MVFPAVLLLLVTLLGYLFNLLVTLLGYLFGTLLRWMDQALGCYGNFTATRSSYFLYGAGFATISAAAFCFLQLGLPLGKTATPWAMFGVMFYQGVVGTALFMKHRGDLKNDTQSPEANPQYPHVRVFFKSIVPVGSLAIFTLLDDLLKTMNTIFSPCLLFAAYLHVLTIFSNLRATDPFGICDAFLAAAYGLLYNLCSTKPAIYSLILATLVLTGIRNLQFFKTIEENERIKRNEIEKLMEEEENARRAKAAEEASASSKKKNKNSRRYN